MLIGYFAYFISTFIMSLFLHNTSDRFRYTLTQSSIGLSAVCDLVNRVTMTWNLQLRGPNGTVRRIEWDEYERIEVLQSNKIECIAIIMSNLWNHRLHQAAVGVLSRRQNPAYALL